MSKRPCVCDRPQCHLCGLARSDPAYQLLWGLPVTATRPVSVAAATPACQYEGPVIESAVCQCSDPELRHVRLCASPHADAPDKCVRGPSADPAVWSCVGCPFRG